MSNPETDEAVKDLIARLNADIEFLSAEIWVDASLKPTLKNLREAVELLSRPSAQEREAIIEQCAKMIEAYREHEPETVLSAALRYNLAFRIRALKTDTPDR